MSVAKRVAQRLGLHPADVPAFVLRNERDDRHLVAMLAAILRPDSNAIDVGAHEGSVLREIVRLAPNGKHLALEPIPAFAAGLAREFPGVDVHAVAASDTAGTSSFQWVEGAPAYSGLKLRADVSLTPTTLTVPTVRLDDLVDVAPAFIKIDVEGGEEGVLRGAQETLARYRPVVAFEHGAGGVYGTTPEAVFALLDEAGLRVFDMDGEGPFSLDEFVDIAAAAKRFNFLASPA